MFDLGTLSAVAVAAMVLACPLMMIGMMGMAAFPVTRRLMGGHGGHMMCHGGAHGAHDEEQTAAR